MLISLLSEQLSKSSCEWICIFRSDLELNKPFKIKHPNIVASADDVPGAWAERKRLLKWKFPNKAMEESGFSEMINRHLWTVQCFQVKVHVQSKLLKQLKSWRVSLQRLLWHRRPPPSTFQTPSSKFVQRKNNFILTVDVTWPFHLSFCSFSSFYKLQIPLLSVINFTRPPDYITQSPSLQRPLPFTQNPTNIPCIPFLKSNQLLFPFVNFPKNKTKTLHKIT